jgi:hypothetical protein
MKFTLTESERQRILNLHMEKGYRKPINEDLLSSNFGNPQPHNPEDFVELDYDSSNQEVILYFNDETTETFKIETKASYSPGEESTYDDPGYDAKLDVSIQGVKQIDPIKKSWEPHQFKAYLDSLGAMEQLNDTLHNDDAYESAADRHYSSRWDTEDYGDMDEAWASAEGGNAPDKGIWYDQEGQRTDEPKEFSTERTFGPDEYEDFMQFINNCDNKWCVQAKHLYDLYTKGDGSNIKVRMDEQMEDDAPDELRIDDHVHITISEFTLYVNDGGDHDDAYVTIKLDHMGNIVNIDMNNLSEYSDEEIIAFVKQKAAEGMFDNFPEYVTYSRETKQVSTDH